ncbi:MAG TPA: HIT family protein [Candidatus Binatia bacterium]|nr:HIT family protein [Candidatus Binatia bacterium]
MAQFQIHHQLLLDTHRLGRFEFSHILLHKNAAVPWFILVPETSATDLLDLPADLRVSVMNEAARVSMFIKNDLNYSKVNFAAIGNIVPQLHVHVVGRKPGDPCWPAPIWGNLKETGEYSSARIGEITKRLVEFHRLDAGL